MIVACLLIMGTFSLVALNLDHMLGDLEAENEFLAYIDDSYSEQQARAVRKEIEAVPNVGEITFVTRAQAKADFLEGRESNPLLESLPDEVLRTTLSFWGRQWSRSGRSPAWRIPPTQRRSPRASCWCVISPPAWRWC